MKRVLFIVNPRSGKGTIKYHILDILDIFSKKDMDLTVHITQARLDACNIAMEEGGRYDLVVLSGGDGTLDEVVSGLMQGGHDTPIGYIPAGSTNDFASSLKLPSRMGDAAQIAATGTPRRFDVGAFNDRYFIYIAAFGLFTDVAYQTSQEAKNVLGHMAYLLEGAKRLFNIKSFHMKVRTKEREIEGNFAYGMITNSESVGGFKKITGNDVCLDDGLFEVILIYQPANVIEFQEIITSLMTGQMNSRFIENFKTDELELEGEEEVPWTLDGEDGGVHKKVKIINWKQAIPHMVKKEHK